MIFTPRAFRGIEEQLRIRSGADELSAMLHHPGTNANSAVLLCPADGEERAWCLRTYVELARALAECGCWVMRFDYAGQGESSGAYDDTSVETRVRDIAATLSVLRSRSGFGRPAVVGARLGGTLALEALAHDSGVGSLVLVEPVLDVEAYRRNLLRVNLTMQMVLYEKVIRSSEQLVDDLTAGGHVSANGYNLTQRFFKGVAELRPAQRLAMSQVPMTILTTPAMRVPETSACVRRMSFPPFWKEPKAEIQPPQVVIDAVVESLSGDPVVER